MKVEVLYIEGCPNHQPAVDRVRSVMMDLGITAGVAEVKIINPEMAKATGFMGSPSIRVNGVDIEHAARNADQVGYGCRTYLNGRKREGVPSVEMVRQALKRQGI